MNDKRSAQVAIFPAILFALTKEAIGYSNHNKECEILYDINHKSMQAMFDTISRPKLLKRLEKAINSILKLFVDSQDGTYHIRKVILALHGATQKALDCDMINNDIAILMQEALNLEGEIPMSDKDWLKLKASADKKCDDVFRIIQNI